MVSNYRNFSELVQASRLAADKQGHRAVVIVQQTSPLAAGLDASWFVRRTNRHEKRHLWLPDRAAATDRTDQITALLGTEQDLIVFDARQGLDPRLFAAAAGTVVAGGLLLLLTPDVDRWPSQPDDDYAPSRSTKFPRHSRFITRFVRKLQQHCPQSTTASVASFPQHSRGRVSASTAGQDQTWREEQSQLVGRLVMLLRRQDSQTIVVQADRGRGKSALVGCAIGQLDIGADQIAVTAPRWQATQVLQRHCSITRLERRRLDEKLPFIALDDAMNSRGNILLVEEASSIPVPVLATLCAEYRHVVFVTTVHGYEGAGRGFALRFTRALDQLRPGWTRLAPTLPVRWQKNDPLEAFVSDALLLNADISLDLAAPAGDETMNVRVVEQQELLDNETLLRDIFALLVQAHYQTTPLDLRHLLDQPTMRLWVLTLNGRVCGALLVVLEGSITHSLHEAIVSKQRRLPDQLLPQLLAQCANDASALQGRYARVVRIAIHPERQRLGFGSRLLHVAMQELAEHIDAMGASFGADHQVMGFWLKQGFAAFHYGFRRNARSGMRPVCVLRQSTTTSNHTPLGDTFDSARRHFLDNMLARWHTEDDSPDPLINGLFAPATVQSARRSSANPMLRAQDRSVLARFAAGQRSLSDTLGALRRLAELEFSTTLPAMHNQLPRSTNNDTKRRKHAAADVVLPLWLQIFCRKIGIGNESHRQRERTLRQWVGDTLAKHDDGMLPH